MAARLGKARLWISPKKAAAWIIRKIFDRCSLPTATPRRTIAFDFRFQIIILHIPCPVFPSAATIS
jgi:hypothetical protein